jgi:hypothetical protein
MKGYGLTVVQGTEPEKFDVEVIGVLNNFRPRQELILVKTKHPRLEVAKVVAGMSGSPIYLDGKMVGAYAYGWTFGAEPVAGVTPIQHMLDDLARPLPDAIDGWPLRALPPKPKKTAHGGSSSTQRFAGAIQRYDLKAHATQLADNSEWRRVPADAPVRPVSTPLLLGGVTTAGVELARELFTPLGLEPLQAGGGGDPDPKAPKRYVDGGAIAVQLFRGDMSGNGIGTVTRVEGDKLVAFGHPMMESGVSALPTAIARVLWFLASDMRSFKIGEAVRPVGALVNDRQASIVVSHSAQAPVVPVHVKINGVPGAPHTDWKMEVAHQKFMTPALVAVTVGSAIQTTAAEQQDVSWTAKSRVRIKGFGEVEFEDFGAGPGTPQPGDLVRSNLVRAVGMVLNNPWETAFVESVSVEVNLRFQRDILRLRGAEVLDTELDPGEPARVRLTLSPWAGPDVVRTITVPIPKHLAGERLTLEIAPGYTQAKDKPAPENLRDLVRNFEDPVYPPKSVVVTFLDRSGAVAFRGMIAENLPPGALDAFRLTTSSIAPEAFRTQIRQVVELGEFVIGTDRVTVDVRKRAR